MRLRSWLTLAAVIATGQEGASAKAADTVGPANPLCLVDAGGKPVGLADSTEPTLATATIALLLNQTDTFRLFVYAPESEGVFTWLENRTLYYDAPDCTGAAYSAEPRNTSRLGQLTVGNLLYVNEAGAPRRPFAALSGQGGLEPACINYNPPRELQAVPMQFVVDMDTLYALPFSVTGARGTCGRRSVER